MAKEPSLIIKSITGGPYETHSYLCACNRTKEAVLIDASPGIASEVIQQAEELGVVVEKIILTHSHWDHIAGLKDLGEKWPLHVYLHKDDIGNLQNPGTDGLVAPIPVEKAECQIHEIDEKTKITIGDVPLTIIETPGHTPGGLCFYIAEEKVLFSGDTLFHGSIGRLDLPNSCPDRMWDSLKKLDALPEETLVLTGHGPTFRLADASWLARAEEVFG